MKMHLQSPVTDRLERRLGVERLEGRHPALRVVRDRSPDRMHAEPANDPVLQRAGLRHPVARGEPAAAFVVVEMAILVVVAALAMASIIVTSGCAGIDQTSSAEQTTHTRTA